MVGLDAIAAHAERVAGSDTSAAPTTAAGSSGEGVPGGRRQRGEREAREGLLVIRLDWAGARSGREWHTGFFEQRSWKYVYMRD